MDTLFNEIIVDNFAGGGGTSTGIYQATGRHVDVAINHSPSAIAMHEANHPKTEHYCESVYEVNPIEASKGMPVGLCWLSPDCTHFSKARSGKPVSKKIRGLAWVGVKWAALVKPRVMMLENVEEFCTWGPIDEATNQPCIIRKGETFEGFKLALSTGLGKDHPSWSDAYYSLFQFNTDLEEKLKIYKAIKHGCGYQVEFKELRACDYGAPTIRKRLFMIARRDGHPIIWPTPTHADKDNLAVKKGKLKPYRAAAECIDWTIPCHSIFLTKEEGRAVGVKRPLAENTMKRIFKGLKKFVIDANDPFFISTYYGPKSDGTGFDRGSKIDQPIGTVTSGGMRHALVAPYITKFNNGATGYKVDEPVHTITSGGKQKRAGTANNQGLITCNLVKHYGGGYNGSGNDIRTPLSTVTTTDHNALCTSHLIKYYGSEKDGASLNEPMHTVVSKDRFGLVKTFLKKHYEKENLAASNADPMFGLVNVNGSDYMIADIGMRMLQPRELFTAQGFPEDYIIDVGPNGKKATKAEQVARCGNAVPPQFSEALVRANLPEMCLNTNKQEQKSA